MIGLFSELFNGSKWMLTKVTKETQI